MKTATNLLLLTLITFTLYALDPWGLSVSPLLTTTPWLLFLVAVIDIVVISAALQQTQGGGISLAARLALLIFGVKTAVIAVETVYLPDILPPAWVPGLLINGALTAVLVALAAVCLNNRFTSPAAQQPWLPWSTLSWKRFILIGFLWMLLFIAVGLLIFQPLAQALDSAAAEAYLAAFTPPNPLLVLLFQAGRGLLWALFSWPFYLVLRGDGRRRGLILGLLFAGLMGSAQLQGIHLLPPTIWPAHLVEVVIENFLFGLIVAWGLGAKRMQPRLLPR